MPENAGADLSYTTPWDTIVAPKIALPDSCLSS